MRRTNAQLDADKLREAASLAGEYGIPHLQVTLNVVADSVEKGARVKEKKNAQP